jgi:hypothetical protein
MSVYVRGFGTNHEGSGSDHALTAEEQYEHIASILSIVITGVTVIGAIWIVTRTVKVLIDCRTRRKRNARNKTSSSTEDSDDEVGGAKRTRALLLTGLLVADVWVGISWLAPAVMGLRDQPLRGNQCQAPGFTLATALWWQYGFSIAIAMSTFFAVRHPLSTIKRLQEQYVKGIICLVIITGLIQALLWDRLHGYTDWRQFCYYGSPRSRISEIMQFLPRLLSSFAIAIIYAFLIRFLCRPDLAAPYSAPLPVSNHNQNQNPSSITLCGDESNGKVNIPPWEKLVLPDYSKLLNDDQGKMEKLTGSPKLRGMAMSRHLRSFSNGSALTIPDKAWLRHTRTASAVSEFTIVSDTTLVPSSHASRSGSGSPSPTSSRFGDSLHPDTNLNRSRSPSIVTILEPPVRPALARSRPSTAPAPRVTPSAPLMQATLSLPVTIERRMSRSSTVTAGTANDISSFRGMLCDPSSSAETGTMCSRSPTPTIDDQGRMESMASVRNRRTWQLLMWFPLTVSPFPYFRVSITNLDSTSFYSPSLCKIHIVTPGQE